MSTLASITTSASNMCRHLSNVIRTAIANSPIGLLECSDQLHIQYRGVKKMKKLNALLFYSESFMMPSCIIITRSTSEQIKTIKIKEIR